jgi:hypothetical protein
MSINDILTLIWFVSAEYVKEKTFCKCRENNKKNGYSVTGNGSNTTTYYYFILQLVAEILLCPIVLLNVNKRYVTKYGKSISFALRHFKVAKVYGLDFHR